MTRYVGDFVACANCFDWRTRHPSGKCSKCREKDAPLVDDILSRYEAAVYIPYPEDFGKKKINCRGQKGQWDLPNASQYVRDMCRTCPMYDWCLNWGIENDEQGIWGGLSRKERRIVRNGRLTRSDVTLVA